MKRIIVFILLVAGYQLLVTNINAQTPAQVILTWQANNFYPADFNGKPAATPNTPVTVAAEVLQGGKLTDLSQTTFTWYVDEKFQSRGNGLKEIVFTVDKSVGDSHFVRVNIQSDSDVFENSIRIPVSSPVVILKTPYPNQLVRTGSKPEITAVPYFFNINAFRDLNFSWQLGTGEIKESGNDNRLVLNIGTTPPPENTIQITGTARNKNSLLETATSRIRLTTY
jgi:hypothetical protein